MALPGQNQHIRPEHFKGLSERVDYLAGIGVSCLWLMPFYPSVQRDDD